MNYIKFCRLTRARSRDRRVDRGWPVVTEQEGLPLEAYLHNMSCPAAAARTRLCCLYLRPDGPLWGHMLLHSRKQTMYPLIAVVLAGVRGWDKFWRQRRCWDLVLLRHLPYELHNTSNRIVGAYALVADSKPSISKGVLT